MGWDMTEQVGGTADIVSRFLAALKRIEPDVGYLVIDDSPRMEEDFTQVPSVTIDGWAYRADLERVLVDFVASEKVYGSGAFHPHPEDLKSIMIDPHSDPVVVAGNDFTKNQWQLYEVEDGIRVYRQGGEFVVADGGGWVPGVYATFEDAVEAAREIGKVRPPID